MAIQDITFNYSAGSTSGDVLVKLRSALVSGATNLDFTLVEDSISGSSFFVVQHDTPSEPKSRMLFRVLYTQISAVDYIACTLYESWAVGTPGTGSTPCVITDPGTNPTTGTAVRFQRIDLTNGGTFYINGDDQGMWINISSDYNGTANTFQYSFCVCSIERSRAEGNLGVNYGYFCGSGSNSSQKVSSAQNFWMVPRNHQGTASSSQNPPSDAARYTLSSIFSELTSLNASLGQPGADNYNNTNYLTPLIIGDSAFRGIIHGFFGWTYGANVAPKSTVTISGKDFYVWPISGSASASVGYYAFPVS